MPKRQLTSELFYADEAGKTDLVAFAADAAKNSGLMKRVAFMATSNIVDMIGHIHADIFFQNRYLKNEVNVKIKLVRSKDAFSMMSANDHQTVVVKSVLFVRMRKVRLSPSVVLAHAKALENATAKYPIKRVVCKTVTIPGGYRDVNHEKLFLGQLPTRLIIGLVDNGAFNAVKTKNLFNFQHFQLVEFPCTLMDSNSMASPSACQCWAYAGIPSAK